MPYNSSLPNGCTSQQVRLNGCFCPLSETALEPFLRKAGYDTSRAGIAVAINDTVVPRSQWDKQPLRAGDRIEVVGAVQGG